MLQKEKKPTRICKYRITGAKYHLLRKIDAAVDFNKIYGFVEDLYCPENYVLTMKITENLRARDVYVLYVPR